MQGSRDHVINQLLDGRYRIIATLAAGGFGKTFLAQDTKRPGQPQCVVKMLHGSHDPKTMEVARRLFYKEAETLEKLRHPQIPQLLAFFEQNQEFYLVEEFIPGHTLAQELVPGRVFDENWVLTFLTDVLQILQFIHNRGVIHRDLKPSNLIRRQGDGNLVLIDFGAVKHLPIAGAAPAEASQTVGIGTQGYMPTEQSSGKPRFSSDLYALGMMAIQALTGVHPRDLPEDVDTGEILWQDRAQVSPTLAQILTKMVRYHFSQRYQRAEEILQDLQPLLAQLPQIAPPLPPVDLALRMAEPTYREGESPPATQPLEIEPTLTAQPVVEPTVAASQTHTPPLIEPTVATDPDATIPAANRRVLPATDATQPVPTAVAPAKPNLWPWLWGAGAALVVLAVGGWFSWQQWGRHSATAALTEAQTLITQASQQTTQAKTLEQLQAAKAQWEKALVILQQIEKPGAAAAEVRQLQQQCEQEIRQLEARILACKDVLWGECP
ncbi:MAG: protein kinase [Gloeomargarita sp. SKYB31]|nr:protein kinase [Gloeomargarita sp. SKYB31]